MKTSKSYQKIRIFHLSMPIFEFVFPLPTPNSHPRSPLQVHSIPRSTHLFSRSASEPRRYDERLVVLTLLSYLVFARNYQQRTLMLCTQVVCRQKKTHLQLPTWKLWGSLGVKFMRREGNLRYTYFSDLNFLGEGNRCGRKMIKYCYSEKMI